MSVGEQPDVAHIDSWQAAEINAATWMRFWGHADAQVTDAGADGGIDVWSTSALGQVKFEAAQVGSPAVQRLVGAAGRDQHKQLFFFSGAGYSTQAIAYADTMNVALFRYDLLGRMTPVNDSAHFITGMPRPGGSAIPSADLDGLSPDDEEIIEAIANFPAAQVNEWAERIYHASPKSSLLTNLFSVLPVRYRPRSRFTRTWPWVVAGVFALSGLGNLLSTETAGIPSPANPGAAVTCFLLAAGFAAFAWRGRVAVEHVPDDVASSLNAPTESLPAGVDSLMMNLPWIREHGLPCVPSQYEDVRRQLVYLTQAGYFATAALVWAHFVHPQTGVSLRGWIDSGVRDARRVARRGY